MWSNECKVRIYNDNNEMYLNVDHMNIHSCSKNMCLDPITNQFDSYWKIEIYFYGIYTKKYLDFCYFEMKSDSYELDIYYYLDSLIYKNVPGLKKDTGMYEITMKITEQEDIREICPFCDQRGMDKHYSQKGDLYYNICKKCGGYVYEYK